MNHDAIKTGGPAFPCKAYSGLMQEGMTLRDHFAGLAMQAIIPDGRDYPETAKEAYLQADAMLAARSAA